MRTRKKLSERDINEIHRSFIIYENNYSGSLKKKGLKQVYIMSKIIYDNLWCVTYCMFVLVWHQNYTPPWFRTFLCQKLSTFSHSCLIPKPDQNLPASTSNGTLPNKHASSPWKITWLTLFCSNTTTKDQKYPNSHCTRIAKMYIVQSTTIDCGWGQTKQLTTKVFNSRQ